MNKNFKYISLILILIIIVWLIFLFLNTKKEGYSFSVNSKSWTLSSEAIYARIIGDIEICEKITDENQKKFCIENVKDREIMAKANFKDSKEVCNSMNESKKRNYCISFMKTENIRSKAVNTNNEDDCKKISNPLIKQRCLLLVKTNEIRKKAILNDDINFCKEGKDSDEITLCEWIYYYFKNTVKNKDKEGCNELLLDEVRNLCLKNINNG
ncbi:MAG: hypothetical protein ACD_4C00136G0017 [uncultured bacterium (gcode 4)]|uniref:Uncharacterized protein n=1 Tax=uncultured bacterium (gcode 4) TaxID=1234023 RepID=K2FY80_9BACT|nr:MAG: hypothetical protein ACD_4C00136G0017 [uncultured bacterium (gcode 4)]